MKILVLEDAWANFAHTKYLLIAVSSEGIIKRIAELMKVVKKFIVVIRICQKIDENLMCKVGISQGTPVNLQQKTRPDCEKA